jgi:hypothetical protein
MGVDMRAALTASLFTAALLSLGRAQDDKPAKPETPQDNAELTPRVESAIAKGLQYLQKNQTRTGEFRSSVPVATTSVAGLAFLASGSTPSRGQYRDAIRRGLEYIVKMCGRDGYIQESGGDMGGSSGMHGHGFATLFLGEALGMIEDPELYERVSQALRRAVHCIENSQNRFGGWNSSPNPSMSDDGSGAVAIMQIAGLRAAKNAGISIREQVIEKAKKYLLDMTNDSGWYQYNYNSRGSGRSSSGLTGPGMYMLGALGMIEHPKYVKGIRNILEGAPFLGGSRGGDSGWSSWYHYTLFFSSLAIFQRGGADWKKWYPAMREETLRQQAADGSWSNDPYGGLYTSFAILSLQMPYRYLPFFQDGGAGREGR